MRIRYHNTTKKITAIPAPDWIRSDAEQTVVEISDKIAMPDDIRLVRFESVQNPFNDISAQVAQEQTAEKTSRGLRKKQIFQLLNIPVGKRAEFIQGLKELLDDGNDN